MEIVKATAPALAQHGYDIIRHFNRVDTIGASGTENMSNIRPMSVARSRKRWHGHDHDEFKVLR
jgi:hypothetical protein